MSPAQPEKEEVQHKEVQTIDLVPELTSVLISKPKGILGRILKRKRKQQEDDTSDDEDTEESQEKTPTKSSKYKSKRVQKTPKRFKGMSCAFAGRRK
jgi:thymidylate kinase